MTSQEMEARSGVPRANIRYYEAEGLLAPARKSNGYRDYSEEDLAVLERIKLLRRLGVSVEELRSLRSGGASLTVVLDRRLAELQAERGTLDRTAQVCGDLMAEEAAFGTLDAGRFLLALDAPALEDGTDRPPALPPRLPKTDALPTVCSVPKRLFARLFDWYLIAILLKTLVSATGHNPARLHGNGAGVLVLIFLSLVEPLWLQLFATTPGKALLGMKITGADGRKLAYSDGFIRHVWMWWGGLGFGIPIWAWVQMYRSVRRCLDGEPQPWDEDTAYTAAPFTWKRLAAIALAAVLVTGGGETVNSLSQLPPTGET